MVAALTYTLPEIYLRFMLLQYHEASPLALVSICNKKLKVIFGFSQATLTQMRNEGRGAFSRCLMKIILNTILSATLFPFPPFSVH